MPTPLPPLAVQYLPVLSAEVARTWPTAPFRSVFAGQIEQESCVSLTSKRCWSPLAELKTFDKVTGKPIEYGFGLGQITIAYNKAGEERFNSFMEAKTLDPAMKNWAWENRYDAAYQIRTIILMDRQRYNLFEWAVLPNERMAFTFAAYNGGTGGLLSDRAICKVTPGCAPGRWFNHVENTSNKNRVPRAGYGESAFAINRGYVRNIMCLRNAKYLSVMPDATTIICPPKVAK
jgi:hypothetical protein